MSSTSAVMNLITVAAEPAVSLYMPLSRSPVLTGQNRKRLQGLMRGAEARLKRFGVDVYAMLVPALEHVMQRRLLDRVDAGGLAIFFSRGDVRSYALPYAPAERLSVGAGYDILSLLAANDETRRFFVVTLDEVAAGLFHADGGSFQVLRSELHVAFAGSSRHADVVPALHDDPDQLARHVAATTDARLWNQCLPLVAVGSPRLLDRFRAHCRYPGLLHGGIARPPAEFDCETLFDAARTQVRRALDPSLEDAIQRVASAPAGGDGIVRFSDAEIAREAECGHVDTLLLADDVTATRIAADSTADDATLLSRMDQYLGNAMACATLTGGGHVHLVHPADLPHSATTAALLRR